MKKKIDVLIYGEESYSVMGKSIMKFCDQANHKEGILTIYHDGMGNQKTLPVGIPEDEF